MRGLERGGVDERLVRYRHNVANHIKSPGFGVSYDVSR